jgi:hypothetical protein
VRIDVWTHNKPLQPHYLGTRVSARSESWNSATTRVGRHCRPPHAQLDELVVDLVCLEGIGEPWLCVVGLVLIYQGTRPCRSWKVPFGPSGGRVASVLHQEFVV